MKASILALITASLILTGCTDEETYEADVTAINLVHNELDIIWYDKNNDNEQTSLSPDYALEYGATTQMQTLYQDEEFDQKYSFKGVDGNAYEKIIIAKTTFPLENEDNIILFAYGVESDIEEQEPQFSAIRLNDDDVKSEQYRVRFVHTFPSLMGELEVHINGELIDSAIKYGGATKSVDLNIDNTTLAIFRPDSSTPLFETIIEPTNGGSHAVFIAPNSTDDFNMNAFMVTHIAQE